MDWDEQEAMLQWYLDWDEQEKMLQWYLDLLSDGFYEDARLFVCRINRFESWHPDGMFYVIESTGKRLDTIREAVDTAAIGLRVIVRRVQPATGERNELIN